MLNIQLFSFVRMMSVVGSVMFILYSNVYSLQILEAIDTPNSQRLECPDLCPKDYYDLMLKCWYHDPQKRPTFSEISILLPQVCHCTGSTQRGHQVYTGDNLQGHHCTLQKINLQISIETFKIDLKIDNRGTRLIT